MVGFPFDLDIDLAQFSPPQSLDLDWAHVWRGLGSTVRKRIRSQPTLHSLDSEIVDDADQVGCHDLHLLLDILKHAFQCLIRLLPVLNFVVSRFDLHAI